MGESLNKFLARIKTSFDPLTDDEIGQLIDTIENLDRQLDAKEAENQRLLSQAGELTGLLAQSQSQLLAAKAENQRLRAWKGDVMNATRAALEESCDANEVHCSCVPLLRAENQRLREACEKIIAARIEVSIDPLDPYRMGRDDALQFCSAIAERALGDAGPQQEE